MYSDASDTGCASFIAIDNTPVSHINWASLQRNQSLRGENFTASVLLALKSFSHHLSGCDVKWLTDKQAVPFNCSFW